MEARTLDENTMNWDLEEENKIRRYLLGDLPADAAQQVEENLLRDDEYADWVLVVEDELIDDYARGSLVERDCELFEQQLLTPARREKLLLAQAATKYAGAYQRMPLASANENNGVLEAVEIVSQDRQLPKKSPSEQGGVEWWKTFFLPKWKIVVYTILLISLGGSFWRFRSVTSDTAEVRLALQQAYRERRPIEARITGFNHAGFIAETSERGAGQGGSEGGRFPVDQVALDRARVLLFGRSRVFSTAEAFQALGQYYLTQRDFETAIKQFQQALSLEPNSAQLHSDLGAALLGKVERDRTASTGRRLEEVNQCFVHLNRALELAPELLEPRFNRALLNQREQLRREARADWEKYLQHDPTSAWAAEARQNLNIIESELRRVSQRRGQLLQDFMAAWQVHDDEGALKAFSLSYSFNGNGIVEKLLDDFLAARLARQEAAAENNLQAISYIGQLVERKTADRFTADLARYYGQVRFEQIPWLARARRMMAEANAFYRKSENDCAVDLYEQAKAMFVQVGDICEELAAQAWIGHCHHQRADTVRNLHSFIALVSVCEERKYRWMLANALCGRANGHNSTGQFSQAISDCSRCGQISGELGDWTGVLRSQYMLGFFYYQLGRHEENLRLTEQGRKLADETAAETRYAITFYNLRAWSLSVLGQAEAALAYQREAVRMAEETGSARLIAYAYIYRGSVNARHRYFDEAIASVQQGIALGRKLGNDATGQDFVHTGLLHLGHIQRAAGDYATAQASFDQVLTFYEHSKKQAYFYGAAKGRLLTLLAQGRNSEAEQELHRVLALYEQYRVSIHEESNRNSFFDQEQSIYDIAIDFAYTRLRNPEQAYAYAQLSRARSLLDALLRGRTIVTETGNRNLILTAQARPVSLQQIRQQLPEDVQLLEYYVLEDKVIVWVISSDKVERELLSLNRVQLDGLVKEFLGLVRHKPKVADQAWQEPAMALHDQLIRPIEKLLDRRKQIYIIPDKSLTQLPFGVLVARDSKRLLVQDYLLSYASSASVFLNLTASAQKKTASGPEHLLAVGNPSFPQSEFPQLEYLPAAEAEVIEIATWYEKPTVLLKEQATKSTVLSELQRADIVHLAVHYFPDPWSPMLSRIPLARERSDGIEAGIKVYELYRLPMLRARLVVLAACQTRGENYYAGEGAIGISRPFEAAGVPRIVASLWPVESDATAALMTAFHRIRKGERRPIAESLRGAQLQQLHRTPHPYYWAAFITVGGHSNY